MSTPVLLTVLLFAAAVYASIVEHQEEHESLAFEGHHLPQQDEFQHYESIPQEVVEHEPLHHEALQHETLQHESLQYEALQHEPLQHESLQHEPLQYETHQKQPATSYQNFNLYSGPHVKIHVPVHKHEEHGDSEHF